MFPPKLKAGSDFFGADAPSLLALAAAAPMLPNVAELEVAPNVNVLLLALLLPLLPKAGGDPNDDAAADTLPNRLGGIGATAAIVEALALNKVLGLVALAATLPKEEFAFGVVLLPPKLPKTEPLFAVD